MAGSLRLKKVRHTLRPQHWLRHGKALANRQIRFRHCVRSTACISCRCRREIAEAPPVADAARRFRGSAPIGGHDSGCRSDGTTVLPQRHSRIFAKGVRVTHFCRSSSYIFCRSRRGRGRSARSSAPGGAASSRCRHHPRSRSCPWLPAHA